MFAVITRDIHSGFKCKNLLCDYHSGTFTPIDSSPGLGYNFPGGAYWHTRTPEGALTVRLLHLPSFDLDHANCVLGLLNPVSLLQSVIQLTFDFQPLKDVNLCQYCA